MFENINAHDDLFNLALNRLYFICKRNSMDVLKTFLHTLVKGFLNKNMFYATYSKLTNSAQKLVRISREMPSISA